MSIWWWLIIYISGAIATGIFNVLILAWITYPLAILRNMLLWPIMLPWLIVEWIVHG